MRHKLEHRAEVTSDGDISNVTLRVYAVVDGFCRGRPECRRAKSEIGGDMRAVLIALTGVILAGGLVRAQEKEVIQLPGAPEGFPFSSAVRVGNLVYLSGQIGVQPGTLTLVSGGISEETRQTLENIKTTLEQIGSSLELVVKCTVFLVDIADYSAMNEVYGTFFPTDPPARSTVAGSGLALNARVEIECMALTGSGS